MDYRNAQQFRRRRGLRTRKRKTGNTKMLVGLLLFAAATLFFTSSGGVTKSSAEKFRKDKVIVVKGTVLSADLVVEPTSGAANVGEVVVAYEQSAGKTVTRSFYLEQDMTPGAIPRPGDTVLISWQRDYPDGAYLMPVDYSQAPASYS